MRRFLCLAGLCAVALGSEETLRTFDACGALLQRYFYKGKELDWAALRRTYRPKADRAQPGDELHAVLREMLNALHASHATVLEGATFKALMAELGNRRYLTYGLLLQGIDGKHFVRALYAGGPADKAGLRLGDRVVSIEGAKLIDAGYDAGTPLFFLTVDKRAVLVVEPRPDEKSRRTVTLEPAFMNGNDATRNSARVLKRAGKRVGYIRIWYCGYQVSVFFRGELERKLKGCDALVVDLRGRGGYRAEVDKIIHALKALWPRPAVFLIDSKTRSAKELFAYRVRSERLGPLVGRRTEGAVLSAAFFPLPDGSHLELPIAEAPVDGVRLEGRGVKPDHEVEFALAYAGGRDAILERGVKVAVASTPGPDLR